jgi:bifunctional aspartokinase / homoserine dehydrogenase 1
MIGVPGTAHRLFGALREEGVSVILISQGSSEHSICCAVPLEQADAGRGVVRAAFAHELGKARSSRSSSTRTSRSSPWSVTAWPASRASPAKVFSALGSASVNVRAIAQGASERNISVVMPRKATTRALRAVHASFYLSPHTISIGVIGPGTVGRVLLDQLASQSERLRRDFKLDLRVRGILSSKKMLLSEKGAALERWQAEFAAASTPRISPFRRARAAPTTCRIA